MNYEFNNDELDLRMFKYRNKWETILLEFVKSDSKNCVISCANEKERRSCVQSFRSLIKRENLNITIHWITNKVYLIRTGVK